MISKTEDSRRTLVEALQNSENLNDVDEVARGYDLMLGHWSYIIDIS